MSKCLGISHFGFISSHLCAAATHSAPPSARHSSSGNRQTAKTHYVHIFPTSRLHNKQTKRSYGSKYLQNMTEGCRTSGRQRWREIVVEWVCSVAGLRWWQQETGNNVRIVLNYIFMFWQAYCYGVWARRTCDNAHEISEGFQTSLTYDFAIIQRNGVGVWRNVGMHSCFKWKLVV